MDPLLDFVLTITGLQFVFEAAGVLVATLVVLTAIAVVASLWCRLGRFRVLTNPA